MFPCGSGPDIRYFPNVAKLPDTEPIPWKARAIKMYRGLGGEGDVGGGPYALCISDPTNHERKLLQTKRLLDHIHAQTCVGVREVEPDQF